MELCTSGSLMDLLRSKSCALPMRLSDLVLTLVGQGRGLAEDHISYVSLEVLKV